MTEIFDEPKAQDALIVLNRRVAAIFNQPMKTPTFVFVPLIDRRDVLDISGNVVTVREVLGQCNLKTGMIMLIPRPGWQWTAIHELVHLYNPIRREPWVKKRVEECVRYFKSPMLWGEPNQQGVLPDDHPQPSSNPMRPSDPPLDCIPLGTNSDGQDANGLQV